MLYAKNADVEFLRGYVYLFYIVHRMNLLAMTMIIGGVGCTLENAFVSNRAFFQLVSFVVVTRLNEYVCFHGIQLPRCGVKLGFWSAS